MNNLTNTILTKVTDLAQISGAIANVAGKLLNRILPEESAAAAEIPIFCPSQPLTICGRCVNGFKDCKICCRLPLRPLQCYNSRRAC